jgi:hypothetical protein
MVAEIAGFRTRAQCKLRKPRSFSTNITPRTGGAAVHWGGPRQPLGSHAQCESIWRAWQNYHMDHHGWVDIAYTAAFCNHGYVLAGRGYGVRTAANGTNHGNQYYYAFVWIGGSGNSITQAAINALEWIIMNSRSVDNAGTRVQPHRDFTGTECPGNILLTHARRLDNQLISPPSPPLPPSEPEPEPEPELDEELFTMWKNSQAIAIDGGSRRYELVNDPDNAAKYALRHVPSGPVADIVFGPDWRKNVVHLTENQANQLRILS